MFTGIIAGTARVESCVDLGADRRFSFALDRVELERIAIGSSIAVNGVCLTATECGDRSFAADVSRATLDVTTLGGLQIGDRVNVEPALRIGDALDGHWVTGHVDGVGRVREIRTAGRSLVVAIALPDGLGRYVARKGSIAVDGVSLTVNAVGARDFETNIIPHTQQVTIIGGYDVDTAVNLEVDIVARYLERLTTHGA